jgi:hypothetical protein
MFETKEDTLGPKQPPKKEVQSELLGQDQHSHTLILSTVYTDTFNPFFLENSWEGILNSSYFQFLLRCLYPMQFLQSLQCGIQKSLSIIKVLEKYITRS